MKKIVFAITLSLSLLLTGCSSHVPEQESTASEPQLPYVIESDSSAADSTTDNEINTPEAVVIPVDVVFSERDLAGTYEESDAYHITLNENSITCDTDKVNISGTSAVIGAEGVYIVSGSLEDGSLIVEATKEDKVQLVLDNASIHSETHAPIYVKQADKVFITLAPNTDNTLSNGGMFDNADDESVDSVIFSKDDITLNGSGRLEIQSPSGHGIVSKDELTLCGGSITINSASHGLSGKDSVCITSTDLSVLSGKDGIHAENKDDAALGYLYIADGTFTIKSDGDCISAAAAMQIDSGVFDLISGGGSINAEVKFSDDFGMGGMTPPGGMGAMPPRGHGGRMMAIMPVSSVETESTDNESASMKGLKCSGTLVIRDGKFTIDSADDAVHSNINLNVFGGSFSIKSGDDGFHADGALEIDNGSICIEECYEGLEGLSIRIEEGDITLTASDDGLNAAGGTDQSGFGGMRGGDMFAADPNSFIEINGGTLYVKASGDGIDSNGSLSITGGEITLCGPTVGDTAVLDYASTGTISGGTFIGTGSSMMAQTLSSDTQGLIALSVGNQAAGTKVVLSCSDGTELLSVTPELDYAVVLFSCPAMQKEESYTVTIGTASQSFEAK